jgi:hypothetical protein
VIWGWSALAMNFVAFVALAFVCTCSSHTLMLTKSHDRLSLPDTVTPTGVTWEMRLGASPTAADAAVWVVARETFRDRSRGVLELSDGTKFRQLSASQEEDNVEALQFEVTEGRAGGWISPGKIVEGVRRK